MTPRKPRARTKRMVALTVTQLEILARVAVEAASNMRDSAAWWQQNDPAASAMKRLDAKRLDCARRQIERALRAASPKDPK